MIQNVQQVSDFYKHHGGQYFCDRCVSELTGVKPPNQVNQIARPLAFSTGSPYRRVEAHCANCRKMRAATAYVAGFRP
jgi:hypothetical protein